MTPCKKNMNKMADQIIPHLSHYYYLSTCHTHVWPSYDEFVLYSCTSQHVIVTSDVDRTHAKGQCIWFLLVRGGWFCQKKKKKITNSFVRRTNITHTFTTKCFFYSWLDWNSPNPHIGKEQISAYICFIDTEPVLLNPNFMNKMCQVKDIN